MGVRWGWQATVERGKAARMTPEPAKPIAAGAILALAILVGTLVGGILGQPSIGVIAGVAVGAVIAIGVWIADRRRVGR